MAITPQPGVGSPFDLWILCFRLQESNETAKIQAQCEKTKTDNRGDIRAWSYAQTQKQALDHSFWVITLW